MDAVMAAAHAELRARGRASAQETMRPARFGDERAHWRGIIARSTDVARNDREPMGDGDQSPIVARFPGEPGQDLVDLWSEVRGAAHRLWRAACVLHYDH